VSLATAATTTLNIKLGTHFVALKTYFRYKLNVASSKGLPKNTIGSLILLICRQNV